MVLNHHETDDRPKNEGFAVLGEEEGGGGGGVFQL